MRFHLPSFLHYLDLCLPYHNMQVYHHHYTVYLLSRFPLRMDFLQETVVHVTLKSLETPLVTLSGTEERSLIGGLLETHYETLRATLYATTSYLRHFRIEDKTGRVEGHEIHIDLIDIQEMCRQVRQQEDAQLIWSLVKHDSFCSLRLTERKIFANTGQYFSSRRITEAIELLEQEHLLSKNGRIRTHGRDINV